MYLNRSNNCDIYNKLFVDDLKEYSMWDDIDNDKLKMQYNDSSNVITLGDRLSLLDTIIGAHQPGSGIIDNIWCPAIVSLNSNYVEKKEVLMGSIIRTTVLGIEGVLSLPEPEFKNWELEYNRATSSNLFPKLSIDWNINSNLAPIDIEHGVLFWYKKISNSSTATYNLKDIPKNTKIKPTTALTYTLDGNTYDIGANEEVIKRDNDTLEYITSYQVSQNHGSKTFDFRKSNSYDFYDDNIKIFKISSLKNTIASDLADYSIWISSGESFSYYNGFRDKKKRKEFTTIGSRTYLSPCLYHIYRTIHNRFTSVLKRNSSGIYEYNDSILKKENLNKLKKLCYYLATSPLIDKTTINLLSLSAINHAYSLYIIPSISSEQEIEKLLDAIQTIFLNYYNISFFFDKQTSGKNLIFSKLDLFNKLKQKYVPYINIAPDQSCKFKYKSFLSNGAHAYFTIGARSFVENDVSVGTVIYNNFSLNLGNINFGTNISTTGSECKFNYINDDNTFTPILPTLPLADISLMRPDNIILDIGDDKALDPTDTIEKKHTIYTVPGELGSDTFWYLSEGYDHIRFTDYNKYPNTTYSTAAQLFRLRTSTYANPDIFAKGTGVYAIDCVYSSSSSLKRSDTIDILANGGTAYSYGSDTTVVNMFKTMCPNIRQVGINKRGMVWFVDTDMFVCRQSNYMLEERCINTKIPLELFSLTDSDGYRIYPIYTTDADFNCSFYTNNTTMKISFIKIEHMRDKDTNSENGALSLESCKSCYEEKVARERDNGIGPIIGAARYFRKNLEDQETYAKYVTTDDINWFRNGETVTYNFPTVSSAFGPKITSYGGYSQGVIKAIGVDIPYHPVNVGGIPLIYRVTPDDVVWDGYSGIASSNPATMPAVLDRNDMGGEKSNRRCRMVDVPLTGCLTMHKGYFYPPSGWVSSSNPKYNEIEFFTNKTSVRKFKVDSYGTYVFKGFGLSELKSAFDFNGDNTVNAFHSSIIVSSGSDLYDTYKDHNPNYGYRNANSTLLEETDDFITNKYTEDRMSFDIYYTPTIEYSFYNSTPPSGISTLKIKDIEVKVNFLNYPNPKNLVMYLDVEGSTADPEPEINKTFKDYINTSNLNNSVPGLLDYINNIVSMNADVGSKKRLYLLNKESIDNYQYYFSLHFTDRASIYNVLSDYNNIAIKDNDISVCPNLHVINDGEPIRPTMSINNGKYDTEVAFYRNILCNNNINILEASFAKFKNIPLKDAKFTLGVQVIDYHDTVSVKDNIVNNNELAGLNLLEHKETSNNIINNFCNWEIIIHTEDVPRFAPYDVLGYINYDNPAVSHSGYNFITNALSEEQKALIPLVNINAPFPYISNINSCKYIDDDEVSRQMTYETIKYPTTFIFFAPFFSAIGGLTAIYQLSSFFAAGGRNDPIVNMFLDIGFQRQQEEIEKNYYQAVHDGYGRANKAIVLASKDKIHWYQMEVPIFNYANTPVLTRNKYKYIKLDKSIFLGRFVGKRVQSLVELIDDSEISYTMFLDEDEDIPSSRSITIGDQSITLNKGDYVLINQTGSPSKVYVVDDSEWATAPSIKYGKFASMNKAITNETLTSAYIGARQLLAINGSHAYYYFDKNDQLDSSVGTVIDKALLYVNGSYKTILTLGGPIETDNIEVSKSSNINTILLYKDHVTDRDSTGVGKWSLNKSADEKLLNCKIDKHPSAVGEGSVGFGTNAIDPIILDKIKPKYNEIYDTAEMLDYTKNNKYNFNSLDIISGINGSATYLFFTPQDDPEDLLSGYSYSIYDFDLDKPEVLIDNKIIEKNKLDKIKAIINSNVTLSKDNQNPLFMALKSNKFEDIPDYGEVVINGDYIASKPKIYLTSGQMGSLALRLVKIGDIITNLINEYHNTPDDPPECNTPEGLGNNNCVKKDKMQEINSYTREKNLIHQLLQNAVNDQHTLSQDILTNSIPELDEDQTSKAWQILKEKHKYPTISKLLEAIGMSQEDYDDLLGSAISNQIIPDISHKNYYWISIDKEQYCNIAQEASIKILKKVTYKCSPILEYYQYPACNPICGDGTTKKIEPADSLYTSNPGQYQNIEQDTDTMTYTIPETEIDRQKALYSSVTEWVDSENSPEYAIYEKKFLIQCGEEETGTGGARDTLVTVKEYYIYPKKPTAASNKVKDIFNLDNSDTIYIKFKNIPRKIKNADPIYTLYTYDYNGNLGKSITPSPGGPLQNNFSVWQCYGFDDDEPQLNGDPFYGKQLEPPDFFKLQNEMIFRGFFGSVDGAEHKNTSISSTKEPWEWIPYEYFNRPIIE